MSDTRVKEIEKDMSDLFYGGKKLPGPYAVSVPLGKGV